MAVSNYIPQTLAEMTVVNKAVAERWIKDNAAWVATMIEKHTAWIKDTDVSMYQAAYDGELEEIEKRTKARDGGTENKLISNYVQIIVDTLVDYMLGKSPIYTVEDPDQDDEETEEREIITEYRKKIMKLLQNKALLEFSALLREMCISGYGSIIVWVDETGAIDYKEYPVDEIVPVYDGRGRLRLVMRKYTVDVWENGGEVTKYRLEVYDKRYVTYYIGESEGTYSLDPAETVTGNPIEHYAGRIPVVVCQNQLPAKYEERVKGYGKSDLAYGVVPLAVAYCHGVSDKANLMEYLQDQYLCLTGVDVDENEVLKMRKARALALKNKESKADFIAQSQDDNAVENGLTRMKNDIFDTTNTPRLSELEGATATEIRMKYSGLDIKAGKKEPLLIQAFTQFLSILTDLLNTQKLVADGAQTGTYETITTPELIELRDDLYQSEWVSVTISRNLPQNNKELADIVAELADIVPDSYLYELLWFIDDPQKALEEMKAQKEEASKNSLTAIGYGADNLGDTGGVPPDDEEGQEGKATGSSLTQPVE
ncbi:phage portal protein [uncultured Robinsoniella sp.]|uniref:phage portal protein n=1 Tax=uncultured Robinsoniella sp. TaxID=904190 RepID=UPI00374F54EF